MVDTTQTTTEKKLTQSDIRGVFLRSNLFQGSWNFERMQALGFCFSMVPAIRRLYPENNEARKQAIRRHLEFFNTQPFVAAPILGVTLALEEQRANGAEIDDGAINGIKVGLMGPLAGVGDPIFWGTVRPVFAALGAGIAMSGSLLGPLLFFILFNLVRLATRYYGVAYGYSKGIDIVKDMGGGFLQKLTEGASILGLFVMGALVNKWTHVNIRDIQAKRGDFGQHIGKYVCVIPFTTANIQHRRGLIIKPFPQLGDNCITQRLIMSGI